MSLPSPEDMSHAMLIAVLMDQGGSYDMPADALSVDALGTADGAFHAVELLPLPTAASDCPWFLARPGTLAGWSSGRRADRA